MFPGRLRGMHVVVVTVGSLLGQNAISERGTALEDETQITPVAKATDDVVAVYEALCL